ncbi:MAG: carbohydrate ABC transporter permease [Lachnospiraceae bacterium]
MGKKKGDRAKRWLRSLLRGIVLAMAVLSVLPLVILACGAFTGENELYRMLGPVIGTEEGYAGWHFIPLYPTLKNIIELFFDTPEYYVLFWNSIKIVGIILAGQLIFAVPAAWGLARCKGKWGRWVFGLYMFCMILPFQVTMLSQYIVLNGMHLINTHWAIILPLLFSTFPVFIMYSSFEQIPDSVVEAAKMDGAGRLCIFFHIAVPMAEKGIASAVILGFLEYWNIVEQPVVFLKDKALWPLSVYLPDIAEGSIGRAFTFALFSCIPPLVVFYMGKDILADGISVGSAED